MAGKILRGILLAAAVVFLAHNLYNDRNDLYGAIVFNRVNFLTIVFILYLAADYVKELMNICLLVLLGGLVFHGYMYYKVYNDNGNSEQAKVRNCDGEGSTWYSKLNDRCY